MSWLKTAGVATLLVLATVGGASLLGYDISIQREATAPVISGDTTPATGNTPTATTTSANADSGVTAGYDQNAVRERFYALLNNFRKANDRAAVEGDTAVVRAAESHSEDMAERGFFAHDNPEGETPRDRLQRAGARCTRSGENIAQTWWRERLMSNPGPQFIDSADDLARALFVQWRESPGHREVMLLRGINDVGLGLAQTKRGKVYATMDVC